MTLDQAMTALSILVERNSKNISYKFYLRPTIEGKIEIYKK